jgi:hypothetical protein
MLVGVYVFVKKPQKAGGATKIKLPGIEAELPVASLLPMLLGVVLIITATQLEATPAVVPSPEPLPPRGGPAPNAPEAERPAACVSSTAVSLVVFKWAPSDCPDDPGTPLRIDTCQEQRTLNWLRARLAELRNAKVEGFRELPASFDLVPADAYGKKDWSLRLMSGSEHVYNVGVGYNVKSGAKDGCLSLTWKGKALTPSACMDKSGQWWVRRGPELCPVRDSSATR